VNTVPQIFLSYAREDADKVEALYTRLSNAGFKPWMDKKDILPGEKWKSSIRKAMRGSDFFLVCLSANSIDKRGWIQREIKQALDTWEGMLDSDIYLIPVRLEDCELPESLQDFQWVDLFEADGWSRLERAIQAGIERRLGEFKPPVKGEQELKAKRSELTIAKRALKKLQDSSDPVEYEIIKQQQYIRTLEKQIHELEQELEAAGQHGDR
jgi:hypothetical protein